MADRWRKGSGALAAVQRAQGKTDRKPQVAVHHRSFFGTRTGVVSAGRSYASGNPRFSCCGLIGQSSPEITDRVVTDERDAVVALEAAGGYSGAVGRACEGPARFRAEPGGLRRNVFRMTAATLLHQKAGVPVSPGAR